jgi:hypothetical protein
MLKLEFDKRGILLVASANMAATGQTTNFPLFFYIDWAARDFYTVRELSCM